MTLEEFISSRKFLTLKNYDDEKVEGYSYATDTYPAPEHGENKFSRSHSDYLEEHHWISKIPVEDLPSENRSWIEDKEIETDGYTYHLQLTNSDYLGNDLARFEKMLYEFIYGHLGSNEADHETN